MIKFENVEVTGFSAAIRGMRNPLNSWDKSDSIFTSDGKLERIGDRDWNLMNNLIGSGNDHSKFMRMIHASMDITAPLYWWKEFSTYKVGTTSNSCSTMHTLHKRDLTIEDFSTDLLEFTECPVFEYGDGEIKTIVQPFDVLKEYIIPALNLLRKKYVQTGNKKYWYSMIQLLPNSFMQKRTVDLNYAVLRNMYNARKHHKLTEWLEFCSFIDTLPYSSIITF